MQVSRYCCRRTLSLVAWPEIYGVFMDDAGSLLQTRSRYSHEAEIRKEINPGKIRSGMNCGMTGGSCVRRCRRLPLEIILDDSLFVCSFDEEMIEKWFEDRRGTADEPSVQLENANAALAAEVV